MNPCAHAGQTRARWTKNPRAKSFFTVLICDAAGHWRNDVAILATGVAAAVDAAGGGRCDDVLACACGQDAGAAGCRLGLAVRRSGAAIGWAADRGPGDAQL